MVNTKSPQEISHTQVLKLVEKGDVDAIITVVKTSGNPAVLKHAILFLGESKVKEAAEPLIALLSSEFVSVRHFSVQALGQIGDKKAIKPLSKLLEEQGSVEGEDSPHIVSYSGDKVLEALGTFAKGGNTEAMWSIINALDSKWKAASLQVLRNLGDKAVDGLISSLDTADKSMRKKAIMAMGEIKSKKASKMLLDILTKYSEDDYALLEEVVGALGKIKDPVTVEPLIHTLKSNPLSGDKDYVVQNLVIFALGDIGDDRASKPLVQLLLEGTDYRIRWTAAYALAKLGAGINDGEVIQQLVSVLGNNREEVAIKQFIAWALLQSDESKVDLPLIQYLKSNFMVNLKQILFPDSEISLQP